MNPFRIPLWPMAAICFVAGPMLFAAANPPDEKDSHEVRIWQCSVGIEFVQVRGDRTGPSGRSLTLGTLNSRKAQAVCSAQLQ